jgi:SSS family solute:Na+ symporter
MRPVKVPKTIDAKPVIKSDGKPEMTDKLDAEGKIVMAPVMQPKHWVSYEVGAAIVALVVMSYVFFGGMRGTAWVNTFQTLLFLAFGTIAFLIIGHKVGGFDKIMNDMADSPLLTRARIPPEEYFSYTFIPLSSIMFPHIAIMCMTAEKVTHFKKTVVLYPICILAIWLPSVYFGVVGANLVPGLSPGETDDIIPRLLRENTHVMLAGILGAGIMACVMASDSQILALCTMFTEDIFAYYGGKARFGERAQVWTGRAFIVGVTVVAYVIALTLKDSNIFDLAIRFAFSGYAALAPVMIAALFWKRSTKYGAFAATIWVAATTIFFWWLLSHTDGIKPPPGKFVQIHPEMGDLLLRSPSNVLVYGYLPVVPMVLGSALLMIGVSLMTPAPSSATIEKYFPPKA